MRHVAAARRYYRVLDARTQKYYYVNRKTGKTTWKKPRLLGASECYVLPRKLAEHMSRGEAASKIQAMARSRIARRGFKALVASVYGAAVDPSSGDTCARALDICISPCARALDICASRTATPPLATRARAHWTYAYSHARAHWTYAFRVWRARWTYAFRVWRAQWTYAHFICAPLFDIICIFPCARALNLCISPMGRPLDIRISPMGRPSLDICVRPFAAAASRYPFPYGSSIGHMQSPYARDHWTHAYPSLHRRYYFNKRTGVTTWEAPRLVAAAGDAVVPPGTALGPLRRRSRASTTLSVRPSWDPLPRDDAARRLQAGAAAHGDMHFPIGHHRTGRYAFAHAAVRTS